MRIARYPTLTQPVPSDSWDVPFEAFASWLQDRGQDPAPPDKLHQALWAPHALTPGAARSTHTVESIHALAVDLDDGFGDVLERLDGFSWVAHTSWSHSPETPKGRIVFELSRPVRATEWRAFWLRAVVRLGLPADAQCKDAARAYFVPCSRPGGWVRIGNGAPLDVGDIMLQDLPEDAIPASAVTVGGSRQPDRRELAMAQQRKDTPTSVKAMLAGQPFAVEGERDALAWEAATWIARQWPDLDIEYMCQVVSPSLDLTGHPTVQEFGQKLVRALTNVAIKREAQVQREITRRAHNIQTLLGAGRTEPYTQEEMDQMAKTLGTTPGRLSRSWIIDTGANLYKVLVAGRYVDVPINGPAVERIRTLLSPLPYDIPENATAPALLERFGTLVLKHEYDLTARTSKLEGSKFLECTVQYPDLEPRWDSSIDSWIKALSGEHYKALCTWLVGCTRLDRPSAALLLVGAKHTGKSLLANGIARLYGKPAPEPVENAFRTFNDSILDCPFFFADESWPAHVSTASLRDMVQRMTHRINRKYRDPALARGALRLMIAANNANVLRFPEDLEKHDLEAIAERIFQIIVRPDARFYLDQVAGWAGPEALIARHILAMAQHIQIPDWPEGPRFLVQTGDDLALQLAVKGDTTDQICYWLASYLIDQKPMAGFRSAYVSDGTLFVPSGLILSSWRRYHPDAWPPTLGRIGRVLAGMSSNRSTIRHGGRTWNCYRVQLEALRLWCEQTGFADESALKEAIERAECEPDRDI